MPVMNVRVVRMFVCYRLMDVRVRMGLVICLSGRVVVLMVFVMGVHMIMFDQFMVMFMAV